MCQDKNGVEAIHGENPLPLTRESQLNILEKVLATGILPQNAECDILVGDSHAGIYVLPIDGFPTTDSYIKKSALDIARTIKTIQPNVQAVTTSFLLHGETQIIGRSRSVTVNETELATSSVNYNEVLESLRISPDVQTLESAIVQSNALPPHAQFYVVQIGHEASLQFFPKRDDIADESLRDSALVIATAIFEKDEKITDVRVVIRHRKPKYVAVTRSAVISSQKGVLEREKLIKSLEFKEIMSRHAH